MDLLTKPLMAWSMLDVLVSTGLVVVCFVIYALVKAFIDGAIKEWKKALELSPYYLAARNNLEYVAGFNDFVRETFQDREDDIVDGRFEEMIDQIMHDSKSPYIARLREDRGFGFITQPDKLNEPDIFFHFSNVRNPDAIQVGARVDFDLEDTPRGKAARNVVIL